MEWAAGIGLQGFELQGKLLTDDGTDTSVPICELRYRGIPKTSRRRLAGQTNLSTWRTGSAGEYLKGLGLPERFLGANHHVIFEFTLGKHRVLLPALALMRVIFRTEQSIFPFAFRPNALQETCHLDFSKEPPALVIDTRWKKCIVSARNGLDNVLMWMCTYPSGTEMVGSVHDHARAGRIGITPPEALANLAVFGKLVGPVMYGCTLAISDLSPTEPHFPYAKAMTEPLLFASARLLQMARAQTKKDADIPLHQDGSVDLTDTEWEVIGPLLVEKRGRPSKHDRRLLLDGVLRKQAFGISWHRMDYPVGNGGDAQVSYRNWMSRGVFPTVVARLKALRAGARVCA